MITLADFCIHEHPGIASKMGLYEREYYHDSSDLQPIRPWNSRSIISTLIIINVAIFLANFIFGTVSEDPVNENLWLRPNDLFHPSQWYRLLANGFAHSKDVTHILFNMLSLFMIGQAVEIRYGRGEFLRFYLISVIICSVGWAMKYQFIQSEEAPFRALLGASGAVTGVTLLFVFNFPKATLMAFGVVPVKSWVYGVFIVVMNLFGTAKYQVANQTQVAYDVHLIGAAFAAIYFYAGLNFGAVGLIWSKLSGVFTRKPKLKIHDPIKDSIPDRIKEEADRILEKVHQHGQDSLTTKERQTLEEYSRAVRKQRQK